MAVQYQQGSHSIYVHKGLEEGATPFSPESPANEIAVDSRPNYKAMAILAMGVAYAYKSVNTITRELDAMGHERLSASIKNASVAIAMGTAIIATKGLALIPLAYDAGTTLFTEHRGIERQKVEIGIERRLKGSRVSFNQGRVYNE